MSDSPSIITCPEAVVSRADGRMNHWNLEVSQTMKRNVVSTTWNAMERTRVLKRHGNDYSRSAFPWVECNQKTDFGWKSSLQMWVPAVLIMELIIKSLGFTEFWTELGNLVWLVRLLCCCSYILKIFFWFQGEIFLIKISSRTWGMHSFCLFVCF